MQSIIGTLLSVEKFLSNESTDLTVNTIEDPNKKVYTLNKDRVYIVPSYQRELRWEEKQLFELIHDIMDNKQFLGNVILSRKNNNYEIIDGQQRITVLRMLIQFIYKTHPFPEYLKQYRMCSLDIESFKEYSTFENINFNLTGNDADKIIKSDDYNQAKRYSDLWSLLENSEILRGAESKSEFLKKLFSSNINVLINNDTASDFEVEYFVDVNQKGVKLDIEDTLKGYLFQIGSPQIRDKWVEIKKQCHNLSNYISCDNWLLLVFEQYYYCELYKDESYSKLVFKQDFTLKTNFTHTPTGKHYLKDTHLVQVICNNRNVVKDLENISSILTVLNYIAINENYPHEFKSLFNSGVLSGKDKLEENGIVCIFDLLRRILKETNEVPKILVLKYIIDILLNKKYKDMTIDDANRKNIKRDYQVVFSLFTLFTLFTLSASKKQRDKIYDAVKDINWINKVSDTIDWFLRKESVLKSKYTMAYRTFTKEQTENTEVDLLRCKSIALLFNFLTYDSKTKLYTFKKHDMLYDFLKDKKAYSLEHFLLNQGLSCIMADESKSSCQYPTSVYKYIGSCFNFIYIHRDINGAILGNKTLFSKTQILLKNGEAYDNLSIREKNTLDEHPVSCSYSQMILTLLKSDKYFSEYNRCSKTSPSILEDYFTTNYTDEYVAFVDAIINEFYSKLKKLK